MRIKESSCTQRAMISMAMSLGPTLGTHSGSSSCTSTVRARVVCVHVRACVECGGCVGVVCVCGVGVEGIWSEV